MNFTKIFLIHILATLADESCRSKACSKHACWKEEKKENLSEVCSFSFSRKKKYEVLYIHFKENKCMSKMLVMLPTFRTEHNFISIVSIEPNQKYS